MNADRRRQELGFDLIETVRFRRKADITRNKKARFRGAVYEPTRLGAKKPITPAINSERIWHKKSISSKTCWIID